MALSMFLGVTVQTEREVLIAKGLFATTAVNSAGANGLFYGNPGQFSGFVGCSSIHFRG